MTPASDVSTSPPKAVSWGEATTDEMCIAFLGVTLDGATVTSSSTVESLGFVGGADAPVRPAAR